MRPVLNLGVRKLTVLSAACAIGACLGGLRPAPGMAAQAHAASGQVRQVDPRHAPPIPLKNLHTGELLNLRMFDDAGQLRDEALTELRGFLRCVRTGNDHPIHWRLTTILVALAAHFPGKTMTVVSGYRDPRVRTSSAHRSNHTRGRAIDLRIEGVSNRALRDLVRRSFEGVGIGYYPNSSFVHIDIRERSAQWIDFAGPGQAACYSKTVRADLDSGTAERLTYIEAKRRGCK